MEILVHPPAWASDGATASPSTLSNPSAQAGWSFRRPGHVVEVASATSHAASTARSRPHRPLLGRSTSRQRPSKPKQSSFCCAALTTGSLLSRHGVRDGLLYSTRSRLSGHPRRRQRHPGVLATTRAGGTVQVLLRGDPRRGGGGGRRSRGPHAWRPRLRVRRRRDPPARPNRAGPRFRSRLCGCTSRRVVHRQSEDGAWYDLDTARRTTVWVRGYLKGVSPPVPRHRLWRSAGRLRAQGATSPTWTRRPQRKFLRRFHLARCARRACVHSTLNTPHDRPPRSNPARAVMRAVARGRRSRRGTRRARRHYAGGATRDTCFSSRPSRQTASPLSGRPPRGPRRAERYVGVARTEIPDRTAWPSR